jgi:L-lactate dehydrogenase complex protein LldG
MNDREAIYSALRSALRRRTRRTPLPDWDPELCVSRRRLPAATACENFLENLRAAGGIPVTSAYALASHLRATPGTTVGYCDPALEQPVGRVLAGAGIEVRYLFERGAVDAYAFAVTRATGAIAETGSVILDDERTTDRLAALAPWTHVAVVSPSEIFGTIGEALAALGGSANTVWATGPSKTADVEGILIEGVHGPGRQVCLVLDCLT